MKYLLLLNTVLNWNIISYGIIKSVETNEYVISRVQEVGNTRTGNLEFDKGYNGNKFNKGNEEKKDLSPIQGVKIQYQKPVEFKGEVIRTAVKQKVVNKEGDTKGDSITSCEYWDKIIEKHGRNVKEETWAKRVMRCESRCNPLAVNRSSGASGLFQYIQKWHPMMKGKVFNGEESIKYALYKYRLGGAGMWVCK